MRARNGKAGVFMVVLVLFVGIVLLGHFDGGDSGPASRGKAGPEVDAAVQRLLQGGVIHSVDLDGNCVRMGADLWLGLSLERKQQSLLWWSTYFDSHGSTGRVTIRSDRNDTIFATFSSWNGAKILW